MSWVPENEKTGCSISLPPVKHNINAGIEFNYVLALLLHVQLCCIARLWYDQKPNFSLY